MSVEWMPVEVTTAPGVNMSRDPRRAYAVVDMFERELEAYTHAPYAVAVDSCTNALFLSLMWERRHAIATPRVVLPKRTYVGVLQAARNAHYVVDWSDEDWQVGAPWYRMHHTNVVDSARHLARGMYAWKARGWPTMLGTLACLSFHSAKQLPLGRGGAILTDKPEAAEWLRAARMDGRPPGAPIEATLPRGWHCPMPPPIAAQGLWTLSRWVDSGYEPAPLVDEEYPDLSTLEAA